MPLLLEKSYFTLALFLLSNIPATWKEGIPLLCYAQARQIPVDVIAAGAHALALAILWLSGCLMSIEISDNTQSKHLLLILTQLAVNLKLVKPLQALALWAMKQARGKTERKEDRPIYRIYLSLYSITTALNSVLGWYPIITSGMMQEAMSCLQPSLIQLLRPDCLLAVSIAMIVPLTVNPTNVIICSFFGINSAAFTLCTVLPFFVCNVSFFAAQSLQSGTTGCLAYGPNRPVSSNPSRGIFGVLGSVGLVFCFVLILIPGLLCVYSWRIFQIIIGLKLLYSFACDDWHFNSLFPEMIPSSATSRCDTFTSAPTSPTPSEYEVDHDPNIATPARHLLLLLFTISQFIFVKTLVHQGWAELFGHWLVITSDGHTNTIVWLVGVATVILSTIFGNNLAITMLLAEVIRQGELSSESETAAAIALAVASNITIVNITISIGFFGSLWRRIFEENMALAPMKCGLRRLFSLAIMSIVVLVTVCMEVKMLR
ncbi:hypothetical protein NP233_g11275 [Leucocoprinus birnbaumii]|uniref:Citrate transporter-like domain-containing protein n=1 Tax=Leucocoprinus birnbaumii TaxID=56174 RepID=A0AAD5YR43_9AGAR|nr:hypothetical protein NP233_g11275 [Leucocoprinus birnbaumii]